MAGEAWCLPFLRPGAPFPVLFERLRVSDAVIRIEVSVGIEDMSSVSDDYLPSTPASSAPFPPIHYRESRGEGSERLA